MPFALLKHVQQPHPRAVMVAERTGGGGQGCEQRERGGGGQKRDAQREAVPCWLGDHGYGPAGQGAWGEPAAGVAPTWVVRGVRGASGARRLGGVTPPKLARDPQ